MLRPFYQSTATPTYCSRPTGAKMAPPPHSPASFYPHSALFCPTPAPPSLVCIGMATAGHTDALKAHYLGHIVQPCHLILQPGQRKAFWCRAPAGVLVAGRCPWRPPGLPLGSLPTSEDPPLPLPAEPLHTVFCLEGSSVLIYHN